MNQNLEHVYSFHDKKLLKNVELLIYYQYKLKKK